MIRNARALTYSAYIAMLFLGIANSLVGAAARQIGLSPAQIGLIIAAQWAGFAVGVAVGGNLADTHVKPHLLMVGSLLLSIGFLAFYRVPFFWVNCLVMFVIGCGIGSYEGVTDAMLIDLYPGQPARYININHFWVTAGKTVIAVWLMFLAVNWRASVVQSGLVVLLLAAFFALAYMPVRGGPPKSYVERLRVLAAEPTALLLFGAVALAVGIESGTTGIMTTFLADQRGFGPYAAQFGLVIYLCGIGLGRLAIGLFTKSEHTWQYCAGMFALGVPIFAMLFFVNLGPLTWLAIFIAGVGLSACLPLVLALGSLRYREMSGTVLGTLKLGIPVGGMVIPPLMGLIAGALSLSAALTIFPVAFLLGLVLVVSGPRTAVEPAQALAD